MHSITWEVKFPSPPEAVRYCKRCGIKTRHASSDLFRVNAQQRTLDIWLIYKCAHCQTTWNMTIYSRVSPQSLGREQLARFMENDSELARQYAMDTALISRNGAQAQAVPFAIIGEDIKLDMDARVQMIGEYASQVRVCSVLREKLSLSRRAFDDLVASGRLRLENGADPYTCRLGLGVTVTIQGNTNTNACLGEADHA